MDGLITLADLPELKGTDPAPSTQIAVARLDSNLRDPRYGKFGITQSDVDGWKRNLSEVFGGRVSIDFDHSSDRGNGTKAAAWITGLSQDGPLVKADVEFTPSGAQAVRSQEYLYVSPTFVENYKDEHGQGHGKALLGAALTNRPVLRKDMPTLSLSRDQFDGVATPRDGRKGRKDPAKAERKRARYLLAQLADAGNDLAASLQSLPPFADRKQRSSDSRASMDLKTLAKTLGLEDDADQAKILAAVAALPENTEPPAKTPVAKADPVQLDQGKPKKKGKKAKKTLSADGAMTLSADQFAKLVTAANAGQAAAVQLAETRFETEWAKTLDAGRVAPAQEETFRALFAQDPALAIKTLSELKPIIPTVARGTGENPTELGEAPDGVDPDRHALHVEASKRAVQLAREQKISTDEAYMLAAIQIEDEQNAQRQMAGGY